MSERLALLERWGVRLSGRVSRLRQHSRRLSWVRLLLFLVAVVAAWSGLASGSAFAWVVALAAFIGFLAIVLLHRRSDLAAARFDAWRALLTTQRARLRLDWSAIPPPLVAAPLPDHPFEIDLDISGERSLHQLLDGAVTREGSLLLLDWLRRPLTDVESIAARRALVHELIPLRAFRGKLAVYAALASDRPGRRWEASQLLDWARTGDDAPSLRPVLLTLALLAVVNAVLFLLYQAQVLPPLWIGTFAVYALIAGLRFREVSTLFGEAFAVQELVEKFDTVFHYLEAYHYGRSPKLRTLCAPFLDDQRPSRHLGPLRLIVSAASLQKNPLLWGLLNAVVPWDVFFAHLLRQRKATLAVHAPRWLDAWFELEALSSIAAFADLHPSYTFPVIDPNAVPFEAAALGHPLIPAETRVCNDFALRGLGDVAIITGSNMAGKSSFLRAAGVNLCLAYAGAPVCAMSLHVRLFRLYSSVRINDSLADGFSYFYAEVRRLKALLDALEAHDAPPLFFLIDEIFRGTNNRERLIGSRAYIRALVGKHGVGVISTHDLELVRLTDEMPQIANYHFEDQVADGRMTFDYKLRVGPSTTTNALAIMRLEGLPVQ